MNTKFVRGNTLSKADQESALRSFVNRFTAEHRPRWSNEPRSDGSAYPVQFASDADWLANTEFEVSIATGKRIARRGCISHPTWPNNPELRVRFPGHLSISAN